VDETFLLVDGENIDATLGGSIFGRRPAPEERPRWDRVSEYAHRSWDQPVRPLFFLNASGTVPMSPSSAP
jgi:putative heme uptake system protein